MEAEAAKLIGAGIAVLPLLGVGLGIGNIFSKTYQFAKKLFKLSLPLLILSTICICVAMSVAG